ncbi:hypothetical protein GX51_00252 [Blastomyces parvus]|uniref:Uncharacterized protein n=1 Tax=Blastomyces parvus TaxID=2060905 RepID=A0A2B7XLF1_9EURO|nr:hypothetical protein GX51_00252 [Blastomyces parvus]
MKSVECHNVGFAPDLLTKSFIPIPKNSNATSTGHYKGQSFNPRRGKEMDPKSGTKPLSTLIPDYPTVVLKRPWSTVPPGECHWFAV